MKNIEQTNKTPEKLREERKNYLISQERILDQKRESLVSGEEYQTVMRKYQEKINDLSSEYVLIKMLRKPDQETWESLKNERDASIKKIKDECSETEIYKQVTGLDTEIKKISQELEEIYSIIHKEERESTSQKINILSKEIDNLVEGVFTKLDQEQEKYLDPLVEFGMTRESALETLRSTDVVAWRSIETLSSTMDRLENLQEKIKDRLDGPYDINVDFVKKVERELENIKTNL